MNFLDNGGILPFGLFAVDKDALSRGFNRTYRNTALRMGIVMNIYPVGDAKNVSNLTNEYDVIVNEQDESGGFAPITYRNCISTDGMGSMADFFEKALRKQTKDSITGNVANTQGQDGAIVIILCLDGMSEKGVIIGGMNHPNRKTTLSDTPHLEGEYNGNHIEIDDDGSVTFTFKGATDNSGVVTDSTQGNTTVGVEKDGSYQVQNKGVTQRLEKGGVASINAKDTVNVMATNSINVIATNKDINLTASSGNMNLTAQQLAVQISGSAGFACQSGTVTAEQTLDIKANQLNLQAEGLAKIVAPIITIQGIVNLGGNGGLPVLTLGTTMFGVGNLGAPVLSRAISGFSTKVSAQ